MSEGREIVWRNRRRKFRRVAQGTRAVSPVVATLILILVAVAAAAALYLWLVDWQKGVTNNIGGQQVQSTLSIGGSTSVYPFSQVAVLQFEQNHSDVVVSNSQGGTGAGMLAVCHGAVDIGASSSLQTVGGLVTNDQCPSTVTITTVAYDAVDVAVPVANTHQLGSISWDTLADIYAGTSGGTATLLAPSFNGVALSTAPINVAPWSTHAALTWNTIPACVNGATTCMGVTGPSLPVALGTTIGAGVACPGNAGLICANAGASPCGFTICAGGANNPVTTVARSDASGTTQTFEARLLGASSATAFAASTAALGFGGCGANNLIADCGMVATKSANGNPGVISTVAGLPDSLGYASDGLARAPGSGVAIVAYLGVGQAAVNSGTGNLNGAILPTTGATGTISAGIKGSASVPNYVGWRPFEYVTTAPPTGEAAVFINYVLDPANNQNFASESFEVSVYSV